MGGFTLPSRGEVGYLDPEIASEGVKVILSDGEQVNWSPPPAKPCIPDWSEIKSIRHYFNRTDYKVFPAWLYHESGESRLVKNAEEASKLGVQYRRATDQERGRYGVQWVWDWGEDTNKWRPRPWALKAFDPRHTEQGKNYIPATVDHAANQVELLRALTTAIKSGNVEKPGDVSDAEWQEFQQFLAFKKMQAESGKTAKPTEGKAAKNAETAAKSDQPTLGGDVLGKFANSELGGKGGEKSR
jgi:hypothetical protein